MSTIANKNVMGKVRIILDIAGYREKEKGFRGFSRQNFKNCNKNRKNYNARTNASIWEKNNTY